MSKKRQPKGQRRPDGPQPVRRPVGQTRAPEPLPEPPPPDEAGGEPDADEGPAFEPLGVRPASEVPVGRKPKKSKHDAIVDVVLKLRPGDVFEVAIADDRDAEAARSHLSQIVRRLAQPRSHHRLMVRFTAHGTLGVYCYPNL